MSKWSCAAQVDHSPRIVRRAARQFHRGQANAFVRMAQVAGDCASDVLRFTKSRIIDECFERDAAHQRLHIEREGAQHHVSVFRLSASERPRDARANDGHRRLHER